MSLLRRNHRASGTNGNPPAPFVVGVGRSGTTLLRMMLDSHPQLAIPPETHFVPELIKASRGWRASPERSLAVITGSRRWGDFDLDPEQLLERFRALDPFGPTGVLRAFYGLYAEQHGKPRWGEKTPVYVTSMSAIADVLPEARFLHLIRDGRDVALSKARRALGEPPATARTARVWRDRILAARSQATRLPHYLELRYEDLVLEPEPTLRRVAEFIELSWDDSMLRYHERAGERLREVARDLPTRQGGQRPGTERVAAHALTQEPPRAERVYAWREQMDEADREAFEGEAGELLAELGYETAVAGRAR
jgi:hypothetical protein